MNSNPRLMSCVQKRTCVALGCASLARVSGQRATHLPDTVILLADDLGWNDAAFHGAGLRRLKPNDTTVVPLSEPEGWQPPSDWTVQQ